MTKNDKIYENLKVEEAMKKLHNEMPTWRYCGRLRTCNARIYETINFFVLESYNTIVACIDKKDFVCYDFLRKVYGYTNTSAQHIAKFRNDIWSEYDPLCNHHITWTWRNID